MENFTLAKLSSEGLSCDDDDCWTALGAVILMSIGGTMNQFKMAALDLSMPPATSYDRWLQKIERNMELIFKVAEFIENAGNLDKDELMDRCLQARDKLVKYASIVTNVMQFGCVPQSARCALSAHEVGPTLFLWVCVCLIGCASASSETSSPMQWLGSIPPSPGQACSAGASRS